MSKLKVSELRDYRVLLAKYGYEETDFVLNEENLRRTADGRLHGTLWIIYLRIDRRLACDLGSSPHWLEAFESSLRMNTFPLDHE